jgi:predicted kinase
VPTKELIVVAGPNGAGKSTFVASFLSMQPCPYFCADLIAEEFAHPDAVSQQILAGREFLRRIELQLAEDDDFIVETTLSGKTLRRFLERARAAGFSITIVFIYLLSADACVVRVHQRVESGGHSVPEDASVGGSAAVSQISGKAIAKLPITGTLFTIQQVNSRWSLRLKRMSCLSTTTLNSASSSFSQE